MKTLHVFYSIAAVFLVYDVVLSQGCDLVKYGQCSVEYNAAATGDQNCTKLQSANDCFKGVSVDGCDDANKQTMEATIAAVAQVVSGLCSCDNSLYGQCVQQYKAAANGAQDCAELRSAVECFRSIDTCDYVNQLGEAMAARISIDVNIVCG